MLQHDDAPARVGGLGRFRELLAVATLPVLTGYAAIATVFATVAALAPESKFSVTGTLLAAGPGWLAAYQVPVVIAGDELGLLPLALTIGVCALVARSAAGAAERLGYRTPQRAGVVIGTVAGTHAAVGVTIAALANGAAVTADPLHALTVPALLSGVAATAGVARRCGLLDALSPYVDDAAVAGMRAAGLGMAGLLAAAGLVLTAATVPAMSEMQAQFLAHTPGVGSGFGMWLLCLGYLPNVLLAALAFLLGPGFTLGGTSLGPVSFESGPVPAVPLLAGLPESQAAWWPVLLVLPALVGVVVGRTLRASATAPAERLRSVAVAGAVIGFAIVVLVTLAGGGLGGGPYPGLRLPAGLLSIAAFAWIFMPGALVAWLTGPRPLRAVSHSQDAVSDVQDAVSGVEGGEFDVQDGELDVAADDEDQADEPDSDDVVESDAVESDDVAEAEEPDVNEDSDTEQDLSEADAEADAEDVAPEDVDAADTEDAEPEPTDAAARSDER